MTEPTTDRNVELLRSTFDAFNAHDVDTCLSRIADGFIINLAGLPTPLYGKEIWKHGST